MSHGTSQHQLQYGTTTVDYSLTYTQRKTLAIHVHPDLRVTVEAPLDSDFTQVEQKMHKRAGWILKQLRDFELYSFDLPPREYVSGETHRYLGRQYRLKVLQSATTRESARMDRGRILIYTRDTADPNRKKGLLEAWYRKQAKRVFQERLDEWFPKIEPYGMDYPTLMVRRMISRWGSCTGTGKITLNLKLIQLPRECIDYVIVHELCHLKEHNHSTAFYALLDRVMPDWRERRHKLNTFVFA
ncbi:MAG: M48 family metallopeptidase [Chloroflexi bacterium]|nr:M48 family metallopeptidase [Chloroflexota bacterium]